MKNSQADTILVRVHGVLGNTMRTKSLNMSSTITDEMITDFIANAAWALCGTCHTVLKSIHIAAIFGRDVLFGIPYIADWNGIGRCMQEKGNEDNMCENLTPLPFDYVIGRNILIKKDGICAR